MCFVDLLLGSRCACFPSHVWWRKTYALHTHTSSEGDLGRCWMVLHVKKPSQEVFGSPGIGKCVLLQDFQPESIWGEFHIQICTVSKWVAAGCGFARPERCWHFHKLNPALPQMNNHTMCCFFGVTFSPWVLVGGRDVWRDNCHGASANRGEAPNNRDSSSEFIPLL